MGMLGYVLKRESEVHRLQESALNLGHLKRELEDLGWNLMNMPYGKSFAEMSSMDKAKVYARSVKYYLNDPLVGRNVDMLTDYAIGSGIPIPQTDNPKLQQLFSEFWNDPENKAVLTTPEAQREKDRDLQMGGDLFWTAFVNPSTGHVKLSDIASGEVRDIITDPDNRRKHLYYKRVFTPTRYDFKEDQLDSSLPGQAQITYYRTARHPIEREQKPGKAPFGPPEEKLSEGLVFHIALNRVGESKFGFPLTMRILTWVQAYNEFMKARVSLVQAAAMFAWRRKVKGNPAEVRKVLQNFANRQFSAAGQTQDGTSPVPPPVQYGSVLSTNQNVDWDQVKTDTGGANATADGRMIKGQVGAGYGFPLHYQGDIGGANLATATAMELPVLKMVESHQMVWFTAMRDLHDFIIEQAILKGTLTAAKQGRFSKVALANRYDDTTLVKEPDAGDSVPAAGDRVLQEAGSGADDEGEYTYKITMPQIIQRQVGETVNAMVNTVKASDPYGQNVDLSRWLLQSALEVLGEPEPANVVAKVFPPGYKPPDLLAERGRGDSIGGDGRGPVDFKKQHKPTSTEATGAKGGKRARTMEEVTEARLDASPQVAAHLAHVEASALDAVNAAYDRIEDMMRGRNHADDPADGAGDAS